MISLIAAVAKNNVIGAKNDLPWYLPEDLKHFKELTTGKTVLMGRKTFESIMKRLGKPLPNRINVVITRDTTYRVPDGVCLHHTIDKALAHHSNEDIMVIGGGEIFRQTINRAERLYITQVDQIIEGDVYFPLIDPNAWEEIERKNHAGFSFVNYAKRQIHRH